MLKTFLVIMLAIGTVSCITDTKCLYEETKNTEAAMVSLGYKEGKQ